MPWFTQNARLVGVRKCCGAWRPPRLPPTARWIARYNFYEAWFYSLTSKSYQFKFIENLRYNFCCSICSHFHFEIITQVIDLQSIVPWDVECIANSVNKTGRLIVTHEASLTCGFGAEIASTIAERCFLRLEAPVQRVTGWDTHFPLVWEPMYLPNPHRIMDAVEKVMNY